MEFKTIKIFDRLSFLILLGTIFLALFFFIPFSPITLEASKGFLISIGATFSLFLWLIARLGEGKFVLPKDRLLVFGAIIPLSFLLSSLFSSSLYNSLFGAGFELGTFGSMLILFIIFFLSSIHFQTEKRLWYFIGSMFLGATILLVFELLNIFAGLGRVFPNLFQGVSSGNLVGNWNNFIAFFGLIVLLVVFTLEFLKSNKVFLWVQYVLFVVSLFFLIIVNVPLIWILVGLFSIIIFVYSISIQHSGVKLVQKEGNKKKFPFASLIVVFIALVFLVGSNSIGGLISKYVSIPNIDVRPSVVTTTKIAFKSLGHNPLLGTGPNTFSADWALWQPQEIAQTVFWNTDFNHGFSFLQTTLVTTGLLGFFSLLLFIVVIFIRGIQSLRIALQNPLSNYFIITTLLTAIYSWVLVIVYNPNVILMTLAFASSGMLIGVLVNKKVIPVKESSFLNNPRNSFFAILSLMVLMILSLSLTYIYSIKFASVSSFSKSLNAEMTLESLGESEGALLNAVRLNKNDSYYRNLSQVYLNQIRVILQDEKISEETLKSSLSQLVSLAEESASLAIRQNPKKYINYVNLGNVYSSFSSLDIKNSYESAILSFNKAQELSPNNPSIILAKAQLEFMNKNNKEAKAFIEEALNMKANYTDAFFLLAEIEAGEGNIAGAIKQAERAGQLNPNDSSIFYRLGMLRYSDSNYKGAIGAFEKAVILSPTDLNARYFLGQSYQKDNRKDDALIQYNILNEVLPDSQGIKDAINSISKPAPDTVELIKDGDSEDLKIPTEKSSKEE